MTPGQAIEYMKEGKSVVPEKIPQWASANEPGIDEWVKHYYKLAHQDTILELYDDTPCAATLIKVWTVDEWMNWWYNFCYNTTSAYHNVELLPYERN